LKLLLQLQGPETKPRQARSTRRITSIPLFKTYNNFIFLICQLPGLARFSYFFNLSSVKGSNLIYQFPQPGGYIADKYFTPVFGAPYYMVFA